MPTLPGKRLALFTIVGTGLYTSAIEAPVYAYALNKREMSNAIIDNLEKENQELKEDLDKELRLTESYEEKIGELENKYAHTIEYVKQETSQLLELEYLNALKYLKKLLDDTTENLWLKESELNTLKNKVESQKQALTNGSKIIGNLKKQLAKSKKRTKEEYSKHQTCIGILNKKNIK